MTKALDKRNETARKNSPDRPYNKLVTNYVKACPYCNTRLNAENLNYECSCGTWTTTYMYPADWTYVKFGEANNE